MTDDQLDLTSTDLTADGKDIFVDDLKNGDVLEDFIAGVKVVNELKDKNGNTYYGIELMDKSGAISAKIWSDSIKNVENEALIEGKVVSVKGAVSEYRGVLQMVVHEARVVPEGEYDFSDILQTTKFDIDELWNELIEYVGQVANDPLKRLLQNFLEKHGEDFKIAPAAERLHHGYRGGLLEHVVELLNYMSSMKKFYPMVDYDLVITGIIMHDVGKLRELSIDGFSNDRTDLGKLKGHLIMSYDMIKENKPDDMDDKLLMKLEHIVLSHHGILEYGSPVVPKTIEAIMVHQLDSLSSSVKQYRRVIDENKGAEGSFSNRDWALGTDVYLD